MNAIHEAVAIVEDTRMQRLGGIRCGLDLWEICIVPSLLSNSGTWSEIRDCHYRELDALQEYFIKRLLLLPKSTPKPALLYDSDMVKMKSRVQKNILNFVKHTAMLDSKDLAKEILEEQVANKWPGLITDAMEICEDLEINGLLDAEVPKKTFKRTVKTAIRTRNDEDVKEEMNKYKKMDILRKEKNKNNKYIEEETIPKARILYRYRCDMYDAKLNFKNNKDYKNDNYMCDSCESEQEDNLHVLHCPSYKDLRMDKDLNNNKDLCSYLLKVMNIRTKLKLTK